MERASIGMSGLRPGRPAPPRAGGAWTLRWGPPGRLRLPNRDPGPFLGNPLGRPLLGWGRGRFGVPSCSSGRNLWYPEGQADVHVGWGDYRFPGQLRLQDIVRIPARYSRPAVVIFMLFLSGCLPTLSTCGPNEVGDGEVKGFSQAGGLSTKSCQTRM